MIWFLLLLPLPHYIPDAGKDATNTSQDNTSVPNNSDYIYSKESHTVSGVSVIWTPLGNSLKSFLVLRREF